VRNRVVQRRAVCERRGDARFFGLVGRAAGRNAAGVMAARDPTRLDGRGVVLARRRGVHHAAAGVPDRGGNGPRGRDGLRADGGGIHGDVRGVHHTLKKMSTGIRREITCLFILAALASRPVLAQVENDRCGIMIGTAEVLSARTVRYEAVFFSFDGENYTETFSIGGRMFSFSPDKRFVAVEHSDGVAGPAVTLFDISQKEPVESAVITDMMFMRGLMWSYNSDKLLLTNNSDFLYLYDLTDGTLTRLLPLPKPDLTLRVFQVAWSLDDEYIAFAAVEAPLPRTEYGFNQVVALYVMTADGSEYWPISAPDETVGWYFEQFVWQPDNTIAFTSCHAERQDCRLSIAATTGGRLASFDGEYALLGRFSPEELFVAKGELTDDNGPQVMDIWLLNTVQRAFEPIARLPLTYYPYPIFDLSPDKNWLSYKDSEEQIWLTDLRDSSAYLIDVGPNYMVGGWHPDSRQLLVYGDNTFAVYDAILDEISLAVDLPKDEQIEWANWFCPGAKSMR
jgi:hypothetical protein